MLSYAVRRLLGAVPTLFVVITLTFFMMRAAPGGPFDTQRALPPEIAANIKKVYNLDKPLIVQYGLYLERLAHFDLGPSFKNRDFTVTELIAQGLPVSARLGLLAISFAVVFGVTLGVLAALKQNRAADFGVMTLAMIGITVPTFVMAPLLTLVFGVYGISAFGYEIELPVAGWGGGAAINLLLPVAVLALPQIAIIARLVRGSMVEVLHSNYVRTARAKGLPNRVVVWRHALPAAILPLVSYLGPAIAGLLTGSLIVETIFSLPGIGRYFVNGALNRDYTLVMGVVIVYATLVIVMNLISDLLYAVLDPRVRLDK
ncbi:MAG TPA: oligopeptide ABC transporter permease OppB [Rhizomicrobium sp.]|nr:oligopeptide ABC transporter permease OppB [Rhizomicrobium sp.]